MRINKVGITGDSSRPHPYSHPHATHPCPHRRPANSIERSHDGLFSFSPRKFGGVRVCFLFLLIGVSLIRHRQIGGFCCSTAGSPIESSVHAVQVWNGDRNMRFRSRRILRGAGSHRQEIEQKRSIEERLYHTQWTWYNTYFSCYFNHKFFVVCMLKIGYIRFEIVPI